ncbi:Ff.00g041990.m01.CDS01 [Fusarium sp. VM40]|nr:Ff.00g041990.m01.CDS01 [Fusarium sp. VM40]
MDTNSSSEASGTYPEEKLQEKIRRLCEAPQNGRLKRVFIENVWPELEETYSMMARALVDYWKRRLVIYRIPAMVEGRQKSAESIRKSMDRREQARINQRSAGPYKSLEEIFYDVHDLAGIRIVVDFTPHVEEVVKRIKQSFKPTKAPSIWPPGRPVGQLWSALFGAYQGSNHPVKLDSDIDETLQRYSDVTVEIQVTSLAESLYNRLAHPLLYKKVSGTLSRKEEMVIDLSHGLSLCYSICLLLMQDKLEQPPQSAEQPAMLWGAIRGAAITPGEGEQDKHLAALADQMPGPVPHDSSHQIANEGGSQPSANPVLPVATCLNMLHHARAKEPSPDQLWEWMTISLKNAVQEAAKPPILLPTWEEARFDSEDVQSRSKCYEGTQNDARSRIKAWVKDSQAPTLFWLHAPVGTGKSTLARTIIDDLSKDGNLAAGYFFRRGDVDRNNISRIFPTIAIQLLETLPAFEPLLRKSTNAHSSEAILSTSLENQFEMLLKTPLSGMPPVSQDKPAMAIIIDGLDESNRNKSPSRLLRLLRLLASLEAMECLRLCVLITSRKSHAIPDAFENLEKEGQSYCELALDEEYKIQMTADIRQYLKSEFRAIKQRKGIQVDPWPTLKDFDLLVSEATTPSPLFIYASILIGFVDQTKLGCEPTAQLQNWVDGCYRKESRLDEMYTQILSDITECDHEAESKLLDIVGSIASLERPLSMKALAALLDISEGVMNELLKSLQAVLYLPGDKEEPVRLAHDSFRSFLFRTQLPGKTSSFRISKPEAHRTLATKCRKRMVRLQGGLRKDLCGFSNLGH